jgi:hypothetical protein
MILLPVQQLDCFYHLFYKHKLHDKGAQFYTVQAVYEAKPISFFFSNTQELHIISLIKEEFYRQKQH